MGEEVFPVAREVLGAADPPRMTPRGRPEDLEVVESGALLMEADVVEEFGPDVNVYHRTWSVDREQQIIARVHGRISRLRWRLRRPRRRAHPGPRTPQPWARRSSTRAESASSPSRGVFTVTSGPAARRHTPAQ